MSHTRNLLIAAAALALSSAPVFAQAAKHESEAALRKEAKISMAAAKKTALAQVPNGHVKSSELERENGKLVYSFDIATKGKTGIDEVQVDAVTGALVGGVVHEDPKTEKAEAKAEAKEKKAAMKHEMKEMKKP